MESRCTGSDGTVSPTHPVSNAWNRFLGTHGAPLKILLVTASIIAGAIASFFAIDYFFSRCSGYDLTSFIPSAFNSKPLLIGSTAVSVFCYIGYCRLTLKRDYSFGETLRNTVKQKPVSLLESKLHGIDSSNLDFDKLYEPKQSAVRMRVIKKSGHRRASDIALSSLFLTACNTPKEVYSSIDERIQTSARSLLVESTTTFRIPVNLQGSAFVIPVFFHSRASYPDSLRKIDSSGGDIALLNLSDTLHYMNDVIRCALNGVQYPDLLNDIATFLQDIGSLSKEKVFKRREALNRIQDKLLGYCVRANDAALTERAEIVVDMLGHMIESYPICLRCVSSIDLERYPSNLQESDLCSYTDRIRTATITVSYRLPLVHTSGRYLEVPNSMTYRIRKLVTRPNTIYYGLGNADRAKSYHLQIAGPENSYCCLVGLRRTETTTTSKAPAESEPPRPMGRHDIGYPNAELAFGQKRCGQRHIGLSVKNGDGFSNWYLVYRHRPRGASAYTVGLIAISVCAALTWIFLWALLSGAQAAETNNTSHATDAGALVATFLMGIAPIGISWIMRESKGSRGWEVGPFLISLLIGVTALLALISLVLSSGSYGVAAIIITHLNLSLLLSTGFLLFIRSFVWYGIKKRFREEQESSVSLVAEEGACQDDRTSIIWSPGWLAVDGNRYLPFWYSNEELDKATAKYEANRNYVRDAFIRRSKS